MSVQMFAIVFVKKIPEKGPPLFKYGLTAKMMMTAVAYDYLYDPCQKGIIFQYNLIHIVNFTRS